MSVEKADSWSGHSLEELRERWGREDVHLYGAVASTNLVARQLADDDAPSGAIVLAEEQTEGRGREGRSWSSPPGSGVYLSILFRPGSVDNPGLLSLLAGLGLVRELDTTFEDLRPFLKWPNDVLVGDRKCGGVLCEAVSGEGDVDVLVAGVGLNVKPLPDSVPASVREKAVSLEEALGREVSLVEAADAAVAGLEVYLPRTPPRLEGPLLELVDRYDWLQDRRVIVDVLDNEEEEPLPGVCVGIAPDGALLFRPDRGALRRLHNATVEPE